MALFQKWGLFYITHKLFYMLFLHFKTVREFWRILRTENWNRTFGSVLSVLVLCISSELNFGKLLLFCPSSFPGYICFHQHSFPIAQIPLFGYKVLVHFVQWHINQSLTKFFDVDRARCDKMSTSNHGLVGPIKPSHWHSSSTPFQVSRRLEHVTGTSNTSQGSIPLRMLFRHVWGSWNIRGQRTRCHACHTHTPFSAILNLRKIYADSSLRREYDLVGIYRLRPMKKSMTRNKFPYLEIIDFFHQWICHAIVVSIDVAATGQSGFSMAKPGRAWNTQRDSNTTLDWIQK